MDAFHYYVPPQEDMAARDEPFHRMAEEGLLPWAMSAFSNPTLEDWREISAASRCWMLRCEDLSGRLLAVGLFTPWRGRVWEFDFTAFRCAFDRAVPMARGAFAWMFANAPCASIMGICPSRNRHAVRLAAACGFRMLGKIPGACPWGAKDTCTDGIFFLLDDVEMR